MTKKITLPKPIKTIDLHITRWFSPTYGNTYFSGQIVLNFGLCDETTLPLPFQYGYGSHCESVASELLFPDRKNPRTNAPVHLSLYCRMNDIIYRPYIYDVKRKKDMI